MRQLIFVLCFAIAAPVAAQVYRWVDDDGVVHYSDVPREGANEVELQQPSTYSPPESTDAETAANNENTPAEEKFGGYSSFDFISPSTEETFWNTAGQVTVSLELQPRLREGHSVRLYLDETWLENQPANQMIFRLTEMIRGSHSVRADVRDENGVVQIQTDSLTFYVQQTSVNNNAKTNRPSRPSPARN
ncbi:MAG: DUF4124 domain-containing protein [Gammaproteobacteria bacterium]